MESSEDRSSSTAPLEMVKALVVATRPKQWTKNLIIYFALFFSANEAWELGDADAALSLFGRTTIAFVLFCLLTGAVYLLNDIFDVDYDRQHPKKRHRPIASGTLPVPLAWGAAVGLASSSLALSYALEALFGWVAFAYLATMVAYSLLLKRIVLLDVILISGGFVLRAIAGAAILQVPVSPWLYTCTGLGALFLALAKRRSEMAGAKGDPSRQRETLSWYSTPLLDQLIAIVAPSTLLAYIFYTFTAPNLPQNHSMMLTIPFVVYGLFRYLFLVHTKNLGENPEDILITDVPLITSIMLWLLTAAVVLVVFRAPG